MRTLSYTCFLFVLAMVAQTGSSTTALAAIHADTTKPAAIQHTGKYKLYAGIPSMYIGHFELKGDGTYLVALSSDEESYATGTYVYHPDTNAFEWKTGFFWQKKWGGKITGTGNNTRIEFNRNTYATTQ